MPDITGPSNTYSNPTAVYQNQVGFAPEVAYYGETLLGRSKALADAPYKSYADWAQEHGLTGDQNAAFSGLQKQAFDAAAGLGTNQYSEQAAQGLSGLAQRAGQTSFTPSNYANQFNGGNFNYNAQTAGYAPNVNGQNIAAGNINAAQSNYAPNLQNYQMGPAQQVTTSSLTAPNTVNSYMSPYMQAVVENQQREAQRTADIASTSRHADAIKQGAFGGSRQAIMDAEAARNLALQKGDIQAQGLQNAYGSAQQQFNAEQAARLQAQQANQQAGLTVGSQNLNANLGVQQLGTQAGTQLALANLTNQQQAAVQNAANQLQASGLTAQQALQAALANQGVYQQTNLANTAAQNQAGQFNATQNLANAANAAQYGQAANQLNQQSAQYGAGLGLQGLQAAGQMYQTLGAAGQNLYGQNAGNISMQNQLGTQQQQQAQNLLNTSQANYQAEINNPYNQLNFMNNVVRGAPTTTTGNAVYQAPPSLLGQVAGIGAAAKGFGLKAGGKVGGLPRLLASSIG